MHLVTRLQGVVAQRARGVSALLEGRLSALLEGCCISVLLEGPVKRETQRLQGAAPQPLRVQRAHSPFGAGT